jgi:hypothetical protein
LLLLEVAVAVINMAVAVEQVVYYKAQVIQ